MQSTLDSKALHVLMTHGRATWLELAEHLGVSAPAAADRVRRLEDRGVIRGYAALVDAEAAGCPLTAFVAVSLERPKHRARFLALVQKMPEIAECHHVAGDDDYLLKVRAQGPLHLDHILSSTLKSLPGIARTRTTIVLSTAKESVVVPLAAAVSSSSSGASRENRRPRGTRRASVNASENRGSHWAK